MSLCLGRQARERKSLPAALSMRSLLSGGSVTAVLTGRPGPGHPDCKGPARGSPCWAAVSRRELPGWCGRGIQGWGSLMAPLPQPGNWGLGGHSEGPPGKGGLGSSEEGGPPKSAVPVRPDSARQTPLLRSVRGSPLPPLSLLSFSCTNRSYANFTPHLESDAAPPSSGKKGKRRDSLAVSNQKAHGCGSWEVRASGVGCEHGPLTFDMAVVRVTGTFHFLENTLRAKS